MHEQLLKELDDKHANLAKALGGAKAIQSGMDTASETKDKRLWLWKNFVDGLPEYWAFDNPYPTHGGGDPMTLGEPCGYAIFKDSTRAPGTEAIPDQQVIIAIKRARTE